MSINLEEIVERAVPLSQGHYLAVRAEDFNALVAEVERLRHEVADLQMLRDEHLIDNGNAYDEGYDAGTRRGYEAERAAVVAWLRMSPAEGEQLTRVMYEAEAIERGEHRREGEP